MNVPEKTWTVADVMVEDVETVRPGTPFKAMVEKLWVRGVSGLPVLDGEGNLVGIVSEVDLLSKQEHGGGAEVGRWVRHLSRLAAAEDSAAVEATLAELTKARGRTAADVMTTPVVTIGPEATIAEAATLMHKRDLKRLPVVDGRGRLVGIVSRADLLKTFLRADDSLASDVGVALRRVLGDPSAVTFTVEEAVVTLEGPVASQQEAEAAVARIEAIPGVVAVESSLQPAL